LSAISSSITKTKIEVRSPSTSPSKEWVIGRTFHAPSIDLARALPNTLNFKTEPDAPPLIAEHEEAHAASVACPHMPALLPIKRPASLSKSPRPPPPKKAEQKEMWSFSLAFCSPTKSPPSGEGNPLCVVEQCPSCFTSTLCTLCVFTVSSISAWPNRSHGSQPSKCTSCASNASSDLSSKSKPNFA